MVVWRTKLTVFHLTNPTESEMIHLRKCIAGLRHLALVKDAQYTKILSNVYLGINV